MKNKVKIWIGMAALVTALTLSLSGCGWIQRLLGRGEAGSVGVIDGTDAPAEETAPPEETAAPDRPLAEQIAGTWTFARVEDKDGNTVDLETAAGSVTGIAGLLGQLLPVGTELEFTGDGQMKIGALAVDYSLDEAGQTMTISGGILPSAFEGISVTVRDGAMRMGTGDYAMVLER